MRFLQLGSLQGLEQLALQSFGLVAENSTEALRHAQSIAKPMWLGHLPRLDGMSDALLVAGLLPSRSPRSFLSKADEHNGRKLATSGTS